MKGIYPAAVAAALSVGLVSVAEARVFVGVGVTPMVPVAPVYYAPPSRVRAAASRVRAAASCVCAARVRPARGRGLLRTAARVIRALRIWIRLLALTQPPS